MPEKKHVWAVACYRLGMGKPDGVAYTFFPTRKAAECVCAGCHKEPRNDCKYDGKPVKLVEEKS